MESPTTKTLSPKEFAQVIGVSQSSIKRWVDDGLIEVTRTAGGHRRIPVVAAVRFIRSRNMRVLRPKVLGLPGVDDLSDAVREGALTGEVLVDLLKRGASGEMTGVIAHRYANGQRLGEIFDGPMAEALAAIGELWLTGEEGIYLEHRASVVCMEAINQVRLLIPTPQPGAPVAIGGAPSGDPSLLPSLMAATVLADAGYADINLGPDLPVGALLRAVEAHDPDLVWLSLTAHLSLAKVESYLTGLMAQSEGRRWKLVVGGRDVRALASRWSDSVLFLSSLADLESFAGSQV